jgi:hypothetical protein
VTLREENGLMVFDNRVMKRIFWLKRDKVTRGHERGKNEYI